MLIWIAPFLVLMQVKSCRPDCVTRTCMKQDATLAKAGGLSAPFAVPAKLHVDLARVRDQWLALCRGQADIPFTDDLKLSELESDDVDLMVLDVFERPPRFRIAIASPGIGHRYGQSVEGLFADEIVPRAPLDYFVSQCSATVEGKAPSFYRHPSLPSYARLILPLWGDGHINALIGAVIVR
jgi:hypothetical protein